MTAHELVIRPGRPFDVRLGNGAFLSGVREIMIPFDGRESAELALREVQSFVRPVHDAGGEDYRTVVAGEVVPPAEIAPAPPLWRPVMKCLNCGRPVRKRPGTDRWTGFSAPFWAHYGYWQGRRCPGRLTGAEPGAEFTEEEYRTYVAAQITGPSEENAGA